MKQMVLIFGGAAAIYIVLAILMGVLPGIELSNVPPTPGMKPLTPLQAAGRDVYVANGCSYCHTQQVRPLPQDRIFGRPSAPGDFAFQTPELLGSERTGPDLTNIGVRQPSEVWQYMHLYNPRSVAPDSIMPAYDWLFDVVKQAPPNATTVPLPEPYAPEHGVVVPTPKAEALVAYLMSLKQPPLPDAGREDRQPGDTDTGAARSAPTTAAAGLPGSGGYRYDAARGEALYASHCAACHQQSGTGVPGAFPPLKGDPAVNDADPRQHIHVVLYGLAGAEIGGVAYASPMLPFGSTLDDTGIADIINYERGAWGNHGVQVTAAEVAAVRAAGE